MNDWLFMAVAAIALTVILTVGVKREHNPQRPRRR
jgi:hypothetical protein